jgi:hypothetical protein
MNAQTRAAFQAAAERDGGAGRNLRSLSEERDVFVATLVYELGHRLASIAGFTEMLEHEAPSSPTPRGTTSPRSIAAAIICGPSRRIC